MTQSGLETFIKNLFTLCREPTPDLERRVTLKTSAPDISTASERSARRARRAISSGYYDLSTPSTLLAWFTQEWGAIREMSDAEWLELELGLALKERGGDCFKLLLYLYRPYASKLAWELYLQRVERALIGSDLKLELTLPTQGARRLDLEGEYRFFGDGTRVHRCLRPQCVISRDERVLLRLAGEVKIG